MDAFSGLVDGTRARDALLHRTVLEPPWSLWIADAAPLSLALVVAGEAWVVHSDTPTQLHAGDIAVIKGPEPYTVADDPGRPAGVIVHRDNRATTLDGAEVVAGPGARTCELDPDGSVVVVTVTYPSSGDVSARLLAALPRVAVVPADDAPERIVSLVIDEIDEPEPGHGAVLDRLLDLLLISTVRRWFKRADRSPGWYSAHADPVAGPALRLMHDHPEQPWTVALLAEAAGLSRAAFARRFTALVGEAPMSYLTGWRIALAADMLRQTNATVESIARAVGYANAFALSVAFKRVRGLTPTQHRSATPD